MTLTRMSDSPSASSLHRCGTSRLRRCALRDAGPRASGTRAALALRPAGASLRTAASGMRDKRELLRTPRRRGSRRHRQPHRRPGRGCPPRGRIRSMAQPFWELACFDLDGTLVRRTSISQFLADKLGHRDELVALEDKYAKGEISNTDGKIVGGATIRIHVVEHVWGPTRTATASPRASRWSFPSRRSAALNAPSPLVAVLPPAWRGTSRGLAPLDSRPRSSANRRAEPHRQRD